VPVAPIRSRFTLPGIGVGPVICVVTVTAVDVFTVIKLGATVGAGMEGVLAVAVLRGASFPAWMPGD
jgi:hypothetical protein